MKKKIFVLAAIVVCIAILAAGTLTYYTSESTAHNVITTGAVDIAIEEWQKDGDKIVPYPDEPIEVMPATTVSKIVTVKNNDAKSYIRAKYEIEIMDAKGKVMDISQETLESIVNIKVNNKDWKQKGDWWYCGKSVSTGASTEPLFTEVNFDGPNMTNEYQSCTVNIIVHAQGVQTANNGDSALEAAGWPAE